ncbi:MAG: GNAT family N-acetyltransferase [Alphaproteobacteria bacterium]
MNFSFRPAEDTDSEAMIHIIGACYALYDNCVLDVDLEEPELRAPKSLFAEQGKTMWVMTLDGKVVGCVGLSDPNFQTGEQELLKLYLDPDEHGQGLGKELAGFAIKTAVELLCRKLVLWTDTRFETAHKLYESFGFIRAKETRDLNDISNTSEYFYSLNLEPAHV